MHESDISWTGAYTSAVQLNGSVNQVGTDTGYTLEIQIPWSTLGIAAPMAGGTIGFNLGMNDRDDAGAREQTSWTGAASNINTPSDAGALVFSADML